MQIPARRENFGCRAIVSCKCYADEQNTKGPLDILEARKSMKKLTKSLPRGAKRDSQIYKHWSVAGVHAWASHELLRTSTAIMGNCEAPQRLSKGTCMTCTCVYDTT